MYYCTLRLGCNMFGQQKSTAKQRKHGASESSESNLIGELQNEQNAQNSNTKFYW